MPSRSKQPPTLNRCLLPPLRIVFNELCSVADCRRAVQRAYHQSKDADDGAESAYCYRMLALDYRYRDTLTALHALLNRQASPLLDQVHVQLTKDDALSTQVVQHSALCLIGIGQERIGTAAWKCQWHCQCWLAWGQPAAELVASSTDEPTTHDVNPASVVYATSTIACSCTRRGTTSPIDLRAVKAHSQGTLSS